MDKLKKIKERVCVGKIIEKLILKRVGWLPKGRDLSQVCRSYSFLKNLQTNNQMFYMYLEGKYK